MVSCSLNEAVFIIYLFFLNEAVFKNRKLGIWKREDDFQNKENSLPYYQ